VDGSCSTELEPAGEWRHSLPSCNDRVHCHIHRSTPHVPLRC